MEDICDGVKILCDRMETNPEDFEYNGKFHHFGQEIERTFEEDKHYRALMYFTDAERDALHSAFRKMKRTNFTRVVIETLVAEPEPQEPLKARSTGRPLTSEAMREAVLGDLNTAFDKEYAVYKAKDRYQLDLPWK